MTELNEEYEKLVRENKQLRNSAAQANKTRDIESLKSKFGQKALNYDRLVTPGNV